MTDPTLGGARLMIGFEGTDPASDLIPRLERTGARGVILFARNIRDAPQTRELIQEIRSRTPWPLVLAVDQEGGPVVRVQRGASIFPGNMALGAVGSPELALEQGRASGRQLAGMGFDLNLAPVVDLQTNPANPGIGIRSLGADRVRAASLAAALVRGHAEHGVQSCLKHFPGKGAASVDAHHDLPVLDLPLEAFRDPHLAIFEDLLASLDPAPAIMTSHVIVTGLDPDAPATLSPRVVPEVLRERMGFSGLLLTDDLEMGAILRHGGVGAAAVRAARADHDLILVCHDAARQIEAAESLSRALEEGRLDPGAHRAALDRIARVAPSRGAVPLCDPGAGDAVADRIAEAAVHRFGDARGLLPLSPAARVVALAFRPESVVGVEETSDERRRFEQDLEALLRGQGLRDVRVIALESSRPVPDPLPAELGTADRLLLLTWDARRRDSVRALLERACREWADRLIVLHLRNPFDQALVPDHVTALTAFGYQPCQLRALARVLCGHAPASGQLPAPLRA